MGKRATMFPDADDAQGPPTESLEQRVQRLEDAVASLQDTAHLEDRIVERLSERLGIRPAPKPPAREPMPAAERRTPPPEEKPDQRTEERPEERVRVRDEAPAAPPPEPEPEPPVFVPPALTRHPWLLVDLFRELRAMVRMFFDVRYNVAWSTRIIVLILLPLIFTSGWWFPLAYFPFLGTFFMKVLDLLLTFFVYKALSREARRYLSSRQPSAKASNFISG
ncbi:MAG: hypothetical protein L0Z62_41495 [Gemmataceae bacterium]|nr:hypothetical protein [Gemmataceae bacterium]